MDTADQNRRLPPDTAPDGDGPSEGTDGPVEYESPSYTIGWKKGLVVIVLVAGVWTAVELRRTTGHEIPWRNDLSAAMEEAQNPPKAIILLIHKRDCPVMKELEQTVFNLSSTYSWVMGGVPCRLVWEEHPEVVVKYHLTESPSLLCLNPAGARVKEWTGYGITPQIRKFFLKYVAGHRDEGTYRRESAPSGPTTRSR